jgi:hypothetical protein
LQAQVQCANPAAASRHARHRGLAQRNGLLSAVGAGLPCLITVNGYTCGENFDRAVLVVSERGIPTARP